MDYTKKHRESTHSLLMEKWGYGKMKEVIQEIEDLEGAGDVKQTSDKMSDAEFRKASIDQGKIGSESGMDTGENSLISQLIDILKQAAAVGNIKTGNIRALLDKVAKAAEDIIK